MLKYQILGKINFRLILYTGIVEVLFTILFCYILAVTLQHKPVWLPTISECGELAPEKYVFRGGILFGGILLVVEGVFLHNAKRLSRLGFIFGVIAGIGLVGVACVASNEDLPLHLVFALTFFILEDLMVLVMLLENYRSTSTKTLLVRLPSAGFALVATVARLLLMFEVIKYSGDIPIVAIVEWINTIALIVYHMTLSDELDDLHLAQLEDDPPKESRGTASETVVQSETKIPL